MGKFTMSKYDVIVVHVRVRGEAYLDEKGSEVEAYLYGRSFFLGMQRTNENGGHDFFYLVEAQYTASIIPRLASGLLWARAATHDELYELGL